MYAPSKGDAALHAPHPLEESERLAWQAEAAVTLLERFGELVGIALDAVGDGDEPAFTEALAERERLLVLLQPLLGDLAQARRRAGAFPTPRASEALAEILRPVDEALRYAQLLHARLTDEMSERAGDEVRRDGRQAVLVS